MLDVEVTELTPFGIDEVTLSRRSATA